MATRALGIVIDGATGRLGTTQHLKSDAVGGADCRGPVRQDHMRPPLFDPCVRGHDQDLDTSPRGLESIHVPDGFEVSLAATPGHVRAEPIMDNNEVHASLAPSDRRPQFELRKRLGWTRQRPARRAVERNEEAIAAWVKQDWPRIKKAPGAAAPALKILRRIRPVIDGSPSHMPNRP